ncbi:unnamed protein product [Paramecium primaurelia]|uniref:EGF-like domain-containing protein n=1 Tax=Paramecium primaurelia TaxID=5886 RepID=A0A8S1Q8U8_PARPR|nr:unnamed protein product [Paramecium primaurelia]
MQFLYFSLFNLSKYCQYLQKFQTIENKCECLEGFIQIDSSCLQCSAPCKTCELSVSTCLSCIDDDNLELVPSTNTCICKTGWIFNSNSVNCLKCKLPCLTCIDSVNKCITCNDVIHQSGDTCACESGWIIDSNYNCIQCEIPCKTCQVSTNQCVTCEDPNHILNDSFNCICKPGYYSNTLSTCLQCQLPCYECNSNGCINCMDINQIVDSNLNCQCKDNYYMDGLSCSQCQLPCKTCIQSPDQCLTCIDPNQQIINYQCECKSDFIKQEHYCCHQNCLNCLGIDHCDKCHKGFYLNGNSTCQKCIQNCEYCNNEINCDICQEGYFVDSNQDNQCFQCNNNCKTCNESSNLCQSCRSNYEINTINHSCQCQNGYYEINSQCQPCIYPCKICLNQEQCKECTFILNLVLNEQNKCQCKQGYYFYDEYCLPCDSTCLTCIDNPQNCLTCDSTLFRILKDNSCLCIDNYFEDDKVCLPCNSEQGKSIQNCKYQDSTEITWTYGKQCDDGNEINRDGCSNTNIDQYYSCLNFILQKSICFQCPSHCIQCELNQINNKSFCIKCQSGYFLDKNQCVQCSRYCLECKNKPSNCINCRFKKNTNNNKCFDCEISKGYYIDEQNQNCYSKCGDGIKTEDEECDDGNNLIGDGCNSICKLENYYIFQNGISIIPVYPIPQLQSAGNSQIYSTYRKFKLSYNVELLINDDFQLKDYISLQISKEQTVKSIDQEFELIQQIQQLDEPGKVILTLMINISFTRSSRDEILIIKFHNITQIQSFLGYHQQNVDIQCNIPQLIFIEETTILQVEITTRSNSYLLYFLGAMCLISLFLGGIDVFYNLLDNLQMLSYFKYLNIQYPYNMNVYFELFGFAQVNFINILLEDLDVLDPIIDQNQLKKIPKNISTDYQTPLLLINVSTIIIIWISLGGLYCISKIIPKIFYSIKFKFYSDFEENPMIIKISIYYLAIKYVVIHFCYIVTSEFFYSGLLRLHMTTAYEYILSIMLQLQSLELYSQNGFISLNSYFALIAAVLYLLSIYFIIQLSEMKEYSIKCCSVKQKYGSVFEGLNKKSISKYYNSILLIKKLVFMIILVFTYDFPIFQVCSITLLSVLMGLFIIIFKPLEDRYEYIKQLSCEISIIFTLFFLIILAFNNELKFFTYETQQGTGWVCVFFMTTLLCIQLIIDTIQQWKFLYKKFRFIRKVVKAILQILNPNQQIQAQDQVQKQVKDQDQVQNQVKNQDQVQKQVEKQVQNQFQVQNQTQIQVQVQPQYLK